MDAGVVGDAPGTGGEGCLNPLDPQTMRVFSDKGAFHTFTSNSSGGMARDGVCIDAIALDGDTLKPREDQCKGGNGFGINEDGAG